MSWNYKYLWLELPRICKRQVVQELEERSQVLEISKLHSSTSFLCPFGILEWKGVKHEGRASSQKLKLTKTWFCQTPSIWKNRLVSGRAISDDKWFNNCCDNMFSCMWKTLNTYPFEFCGSQMNSASGKTFWVC